ncbi:MAG: hypothetical protein AB7V56_08915 [Candidatus Nitrosocosmicus sp.]
MVKIEITPTQIFLLGILIVGSYVVFFGASLYHSFIKDSEENNSVKKICCNNTSETILLVENNDDQPFLSIEKVSATFGVIVAGVVGYYFGQRQSETSEAKRKSFEEKETKRLEKLNASELIGRNEELDDLIKDLEDSLDKTNSIDSEDMNDILDDGKKLNK